MAETKIHSVAVDSLNAAARSVDTVGRTLERHGARSVGEYLADHVQALAEPNDARTSLFDVVREYVAARLGDGIADRTVRDLAAMPAVLTANHHGVDFFAQSVQSTLLFSQRAAPGGERLSTVPVFACSAVPLNNLTYPRGLLLYGAGEAPAPPLKLPVLPDRFKRQLVHTAAPIDAAMVERACTRAAKLCAGGQIAPALGDAVGQILTDVYGSPEVQAQASYSDQAVLANAAIWRRMLSGVTDAPELVSLDLETIAGRTAAADCGRPDSLVAKMLFDEGVRDALIRTLDGERACWNRAELRARANGDRAGANAGTVFLWGVDSRGRRVPLDLEPDAGPGAMLAGIDDQGERHAFALEPAAIADAIAGGRLMPALFMSYACIGFARGITCAGAYYQAQYLPRMQRALSSALAEVGGDPAAAAAVERVPADVYLAGMQAVMTPVGHDALVPAAPVEIVAGGGLDDADLARVRGMNVFDAHLASVLETAPDAAPHVAVEAGWFARVSHDLHRQLAGRVVVK